MPDVDKSGPKVRKLEYSLRLKIKRNDWLLADTWQYFVSFLVLRSSRWGRESCLLYFYCLLDVM